MVRRLRGRALCATGRSALLERRKIVRDFPEEPAMSAEALAWAANHRRELLAIWMKLSEENE